MLWATAWEPFEHGKGRWRILKKTVIVDAPGKINLSLDITGVREDGYHEIDTIMQAVDLRDTVTITRMSGKGIFISCDRPRVPSDDTNYAHIAARLFFDRFGLDASAISIDIQKRLPMQAGMGGGSADAAGVLVGMNALFEVGADMETLCRLGREIGADVPFCIMGGIQRARGIGEQLTRLPDLPKCHIVIAKPTAGVSTKESYRRYDQQGAVRRPDTELLLRKLKEGDLHGLAKGMYNVLEEVAGLDEVCKLHERLLSGGAAGAMMSGSGSAVFGLFEKRSHARHCMRRLYDQAGMVFLTHPVGCGAVVVDLF
ncbi:4-(cytidine 5'-diphospho)-2-C-methyl-D-erythritol kinase [Anaerotruncus sp. X29]|nr:4-(cytidine 5'-diphospho)-2-C-methyl-D-erythritol kinase [Anaerotruncus sp. 1XD42-93]NCE75511.1 4-(cytidine 5'-diphospho)-2-C-methyl-D-erythritol kinase [Anaerotruncus sp. X29]RKJ97952.1 4-(cytidine 5'-diphospho)-2-C-methyl-D-erythritol kinase [Anaerotruncus sp. 1XD22-93]